MGVFGAMLMPSTLSLLRSIFTDREQRRFAIAVWAAMFSGGCSRGPIVGGILLEHFAWGSVFLMAVPVLLPLLVFAPLLVPESRDPRPGRIDPISIVLSMATMVPIVFAIKEAAVHGFDLTIPALVLVGLVFGALFVRRQLRMEVPMLDMRLFARGTFTGALLVNLLSVVALVGFLFFVAQHLQLIVGLSPMEAGFALVPGMVAMIVSGLVVVPIASRVNARIVVPARSRSRCRVPARGAVGDRCRPRLLVAAFVLLGIGIGAAETVSNDLILAAHRRRRPGPRAPCRRRRTSWARSSAPPSSAAS
jgi:DHA2 family multidrug resistance protein-like MFS transporter